MNDVLEKVWTILRSSWRFRWYSMLLSWVIAIYGWYYVSAMPDYYQAYARVYVDTDSILRPLMRGLTIDTGIEQRLQLVSRTLLSRPKMEGLAKNAGLVPEGAGPERIDALVSHLQQSISLVGEPRQPNLYTLTYQDPEPEATVRVVNALVHLLEESTLGQKRQDTTTAQSFLEEQVSEYEKRLREQEHRLKEFKRENVAVVSNLGDGYFERLSREKTVLDQAVLELKEATNRCNELRRQMEEERQMPSFNFGINLDNPLDLRIMELRKRMDEKLIDYTERHPEVVSIRESLAELEREKAEMEAASPVDPGEDLAGKSPVYQALKLAASEADAQVASLSIRVTELRSRVKQLEDLVNSVPEIEAQLAALTRNYENEKKQYDILFERLETARMSQQVEQAGDGAQVKLIEPPRQPKAPSGPNRLMLNSGVMLGSLAAGLAIAFLLSQVFPAVFSQKELRQITGCPVFGEISLIVTGEQAARRKFQFGFFLSALGLLVVVYGMVLFIHGAGVAVNQVMP